MRIDCKRCNQVRKTKIVKIVICQSSIVIKATSVNKEKVFWIVNKQTFNNKLNAQINHFFFCAHIIFKYLLNPNNSIDNPQNKQKLSKLIKNPSATGKEIFVITTNKSQN